MIGEQQKRSVVRQYCSNTLDCEECRIKNEYRCIDVESDGDVEIAIAFELIQEEE